MPRKEKVTKVIDGDTFETASRKHPVRLAGVDTPEKGQPGRHAGSFNFLYCLAAITYNSIRQAAQIDTKELTLWRRWINLVCREEGTDI